MGPITKICPTFNDQKRSTHMINNYETDKNGVIHQKNVDIITYDQKYITQNYCTYKEKCVNMGHLRLGYLVGVIGYVPTSILDVGYGAGDFLSVCKNIIPNCYGFDITTLLPPEGVNVVDSIYDQYYEVVTFFDVLEHFENIYDIQKLRCSYIGISLPWCHNTSDEWFESWKHRKPNEHLHHFNKESLKKFFSEIGYDCVGTSEIEDTIRKGSEPKNILSAVFKNIENI